MSAHYIPPVNFGYVEGNLYRSGQPNELNYPFLEKLQLRQIIYLAPDPPSESFLNFIEDQEIDFQHLGMDSKKNPWKPISEEVILQALELIMHTERYPMAVMCNRGRHRTGTLIGCLRKLQRWNLTAIFDEYRRYAGSKVRLTNEQFIELFDTDLVQVPPSDQRPVWL